MTTHSKTRAKLFYGWIVVADFLIITTIVWGIRFSYGVFFKSIAGEFEINRATTSIIYSMYMLLCALFATLGGWALDRWGPKRVSLVTGLFTALSLILTSLTKSLWQIFLTYSLLFSIGSGATYVMAMSTASRWFDKKRGLAIAIAGVGAGLGTLVMAPLATLLLSTFTWRTALMIMALFPLLIVMPISLLLKRDPAEIGLRPDGSNEPVINPNQYKNSGKKQIAVGTASLSMREALKTRSFWLLIFASLSMAVNLFLIMTHLVPHTTDIGYNPEDAASVLSVLGGAAILGRLLMGLVCDRLGSKTGTLISTLLQFAAMLWLIWAKELWQLYLFAALFGISYGGIGSSYAALTSHAFGLRRIGTIMGVLDIGFGTGAALGPAIGGYVFDVTKSYTIAFIIGAASILATTLLTTTTRRETGLKDRIYLEVKG